MKMKKILTAAAFAAFALGAMTMTSCEKYETYTSDYIVKNGTAAEITVHNYSLYGAVETALAPGASVSLYSAEYKGSKGAELPDVYGEDDILPFGDATAYELPDGEYWFGITVGGATVPGEIWKRKHWSFESDNIDRVYTLTVTDELLAEIGSVSE